MPCKTCDEFSWRTEYIGWCRYHKIEILNPHDNIGCPIHSDFACKRERDITSNILKHGTEKHHAGGD